MVEQTVADAMRKAYSCYKERCTEFAVRFPDALCASAHTKDIDTQCHSTPNTKPRITGWMRGSSTRSTLLHEFSLDVDPMADSPVSTPCAGCARALYLAIAFARHACCGYSRLKRPDTVVVALPPVDPELSAECKALGIVD